MRVYAEKPLRAVLQVLIDLLTAVWVVAAVQVATGAQNLVLGWKAPGQQIIDAGGQLRDTFVSASETAGGIPFVGGDLAGVLGRGTVSGTVLTQVGQGEIQAIDYLSGGVAVAVVVVAVIPVLSLWLPGRVRYARRATRAVSMRNHAADLLALRALNELPYRRLKRVSADPSAAWRAEDRDVIHALANLQLAKHGLRPLQRVAAERGDALPTRAVLGDELPATGETAELDRSGTEAGTSRSTSAETATSAASSTGSNEDHRVRSAEER